MITRETIQKFDRPGPRYTSYPTAPVWDASVDSSVYIEKLKIFGRSGKTLSLYIHIPFCESLCRFCACHVLIHRQDEKYGDEYLRHLFAEIDLACRHIGRKVTVRQLHWGGGTPTFLSQGQIERLYGKLKDNFDIRPEGEIAIEIDPRTIDLPKLQLLRKLGFNRLSMGVQDFDPLVQQAVNRIQPFEQVRQFTGWARDLGFASINFDLIYGLPKQTRGSFDETMKKVLELRPERVALYSFAYLPWLKKHQLNFSQADLPAPDEKLDIFLSARGQFLEAGYNAIAMDHFALAGDELSRAYVNNRLYRNFMGYTVKPADEFIGLGLTSIGFLENTFFQNAKILKDYYSALDAGRLPVERGKDLSADDIIRQYVITQLMCHFNVDKEAFAAKFATAFDDYFSAEAEHIRYCEAEGLVYNTPGRIEVTDFGRVFVRNICMGFDFYLRQKEAVQRFSQTI